MTSAPRKPPVRIETFRSRRVVETDLETWARHAIETAGGLMLKWSCPGIRGVPDDLIFWYRPQARRGFRSIVHLAEFKVLDRQPNEQQKQIHELLFLFGATVFVPRNRDDVLAYIDAWRPR